MKLVIDIDDKIYKMIKDSTFFISGGRGSARTIEYNAFKAIYDGEPLPKGHWIDMGSGQECSECREIQYGYDSFRYFCANCGARMEGDDKCEDEN